MEATKRPRRLPQGGANPGDNGWRERAARAAELRATCSTCGEQGLTDWDLGGKSQPGKCDCGGKGHSLAEIAKALGCAPSTAGEYVFDPDRSKARERTMRQRGECVDCGGPCAGERGGRKKANYRCRWCVKGELSPHVLANSPTGFRDWTSPYCGSGEGCRELKRPGGHLCERHFAEIAHLRRELGRESGRWKNREQREALAAELAAEQAEDFDALGLAA